MRSATAVAPLAFLSSRACARPMVRDLFMTMEARGLGTVQEYMEQYDARTEKCIQDQQGHGPRSSPTEYERYCLKEASVPTNSGSGTSTGTTKTTKETSRPTARTVKH